MTSKRIKELRKWSNVRLIRHILELEKDLKQRNYENKELEEARTRTFKLPESYKIE